MRRKNSTRTRPKIYQTAVNDLLIRGTARDIVTKCEGLGYQAERDKDKVAAQRFFQTADHYKRIENNDTTQPE